MHIHLLALDDFLRFDHLSDNLTDIGNGHFDLGLVGQGIEWRLRKGNRRVALIGRRHRFQLSACASKQSISIIGLKFRYLRFYKLTTIKWIQVYLLALQTWRSLRIKFRVGCQLVQKLQVAWTYNLCRRLGLLCRRICGDSRLECGFRLVCDLHALDIVVLQIELNLLILMQLMGRTLCLQVVAYRISDLNCLHLRNELSVHWDKLLRLDLLLSSHWLLLVGH